MTQRCYLEPSCIDCGTIDVATGSKLYEIKLFNDHDITIHNIEYNTTDVTLIKLSTGQKISANICPTFIFRINRNSGFLNENQGTLNIIIKSLNTICNLHINWSYIGVYCPITILNPELSIYGTNNDVLCETNYTVKIHMCQKLFVVAKLDIYLDNSLIPFETLKKIETPNNIKPITIIDGSVITFRNCKKLSLDTNNHVLKTKLSIIRLQSKNAPNNNTIICEMEKEFNLTNDYKHKITRSINSHAKIAIIGAGLAGMNAAYRLAQYGFRNINIFESSDRIGGRCWSGVPNSTDTSKQYVSSNNVSYTNDDNFQDNQIYEHGAELIDTAHITLRGIARELRLTVDDLFSDYGNRPNLYYFPTLPNVSSPYISPDDVLIEWKKFWPQLQKDLYDAPFPTTYDNYTQRGLELDLMSIEEYVIKYIGDPYNVNVPEMHANSHRFLNKVMKMNLANHGIANQH